VHFDWRVPNERIRRRSSSALTNSKRQLLVDALEQAYGDEQQAARALGLSLTALELKLARLGVEYGARPRSPGARADW
jgi:transcriptional regulator with GAF, ATPase, and Fis domain